jgi:hypothetical protein
MRLVGQEPTHGVMGKSTKVYGLTIKCMERDIYGGPMAKNISEIS